MEARPGLRTLEVIRENLILLGFFLILVLGPILYGAVENWQVSILIITSVFIFFLWTLSGVLSQGNVLSGGSRKVYYLVYGLPVLFIVLVLFQLIPLPESMLELLSPVRAALNRAARVEGSTPVSIAPRATEMWLFKVIACSLVFVVCAQALAKRKHALLMLALVVVLGYILALHGILQYLSGYSLPSLIKREPWFNRAAGTYVNPNHFAGHLEMCVPLALSVVFIRRRRESDWKIPLGRRVVSFFSETFQDRRLLLPLTAIVVMSLGIIFSISRMGIFSFVVSLLVFALLIGRERKKKVRLVILGSTVAAVFAISLWLGLSPVLERYSLLAEEKVRRIEGWKMAGRVVRDYPVMGTGLGTFSRVSPGYQTLGAGYGRWEQSHNDYLNLTSDTGIMGLAIGIAFLIAWYVYVLGLFSNKRLRTYQRSIAAGCIAGVTAIVVHSIGDFNLQVPANAFYFATLLGLAIAVLRIDEFPLKAPQGDAGDGGKPPASRPCYARYAMLARYATCALGILLVIVVVPATVRTGMTEFLMDPSNPEFHYQAGMNEYWRENDYEKAKDSFKKAVSLVPCVGKYHYRLGLAYSRLGRDAQAEGELELAKRLDPMHPDIHFRVAFYHFFKSRRTDDKNLLVKSILEFRRAAQIRPAYLRKSLELLEKYLVTYFNLKNLVPDTSCARWSFATWLAERGRWKGALLEYQAISDADLGKNRLPGRQEFHLRLGLAYLMNDDLEQAREAYMRALRHNDKERVFKLLCGHFAMAGKQKEGIEFFEKLREQFPYSERLLLSIGRLHLALGDRGKAEKCFKESVDIRETEEAFLLLYHLTMSWKEYPLALSYIKKALALHGGNPQYHVLLARAMERDGDSRGAIRELEYAIKLSPDAEAYRLELQRLKDRFFFERKR